MFALVDLDIENQLHVSKCSNFKFEDINRTKSDASQSSKHVTGATYGMQ